MIDRLALKIDDLLKSIKTRAAKQRMRKYPHIHESVVLGHSVELIGANTGFIIQEGSYINDGILSTGSKAEISIGRYCAIGYRVSIKALTHDVNDPCPDETGHTKVIEKNITIGDRCWIGDNVYIREGVKLGNNVVVGANSVVTKSFGNNVVIAGVPAQIIAKTS